MEPKEYENLADQENAYWWHLGRATIIERQLKRIQFSGDAKILNIGCGTGGMIPMLEKFGEVFNVDTSAAALSFLRKIGVKNIFQVEGVALPFPDNYFDLVVGFDVLEHIKDDALALKEWRRVLKPGGSIFVTVPAYPWLWSQHDVALHHYRRYTRPTLAQLFNQFVIQKKSYLMTLLFPLLIAFRFLQKAIPHKEAKTSYVRLPSFVNVILAGIFSVEAYLLDSINLPFGSSVFVIARKPNQ